jgi:hypothetical protein
MHFSIQRWLRREARTPQSVVAFGGNEGCPEGNASGSCQIGPGFEMGERALREEPWIVSELVAAIEAREKCQAASPTCPAAELRDDLQKWGEQVTFLLELNLLTIGASGRVALDAAFCVSLLPDRARRRR